MVLTTSRSSSMACEICCSFSLDVIDLKIKNAIRTQCRASRRAKVQLVPRGPTRSATVSGPQLHQWLESTHMQEVREVDPERWAVDTWILALWNVWDQQYVTIEDWAGRFRSTPSAQEERYPIIRIEAIRWNVLHLLHWSRISHEHKLRYRKGTLPPKT
jgi:hypothetical protein